MKTRRESNVKTKYRLLSFILLCCMLIAGLPASHVYAENKDLTVETAQAMALSQSDDYAKLKNKLELAKVRYTQSVKSIKLKEKNQRTFRWSPLLNCLCMISPLWKKHSGRYGENAFLRIPAAA